MDTKDKDKIRGLIEREISKTEDSVAQYTELTKPISPENSIGRVSRMDAINTRGVNEAALRQARRKLGKLKIALSRIDEADFGICKRCKTPIAPKRLMLMPESQLCVRCARVG